MDNGSKNHIQGRVRVVLRRDHCDLDCSRTFGRSDSFGSSVDVNFVDSNDGSYSCEALRNDFGRLPDQLTEYVRTKLRCHFMNPIEKWRTRGRLPWKLILQILKVFVVTAQVIVFGCASSAFQEQHRNTRMTLEHLLLKGWDTARDVLIYPPPQGPYAVYTVTEFYEHVEYVVQHYSSITTAPIRTFWYSSESEEIVPITFCVTKYKNGTVWPSNSTLFLDSEVVVECLDLNTTWPANSDLWRAFSMKKFLSDAGFTIVFEQLIRAELRFTLTTLYKRKFVDVEALECYRSLYRSQKLRAKAAQFFRAKYKKNLSWSDKLLFLDFWFVMIIVDDCLLVVGSSFKIQIDERMIPGLRYNMCSLFLGSGTLFAWCGLLRYVGYFKTYNILILTLKRAVPTIMRFLLCGALLFSGYVVCGWVVIGPHHIKFETTAKAAECLFSITNGDDVFSTFAMMFKKDNTAVSYFATVYLYSFIILFTYLIVSLFVAIIVDAYEIIKDNESTISSTSPIQRFLEENEDRPDNDISVSPSREHDLNGAVSCGQNLEG
ncbi:mucolipin-2-like [Ornithodoros turicata]|uniref:mucolipin-2-like n=1 Tax=Ornithodoros turicata TaxID=34597 RepID=UPI00313A088C